MGYDAVMMRALAVIMTLGIAATTALAQQAPVQVDKAPDQARWIGMVIGLVLVVGVLIGIFVSSKRGHQD